MKLANQMTLRWGDDPGLQGWVQCKGQNQRQEPDKNKTEPETRQQEEKDCAQHC